MPSLIICELCEHGVLTHAGGRMPKCTAAAASLRKSTSSRSSPPAQNWRSRRSARRPNKANVTNHAKNIFVRVCGVLLCRSAAPPLAGHQRFRSGPGVDRVAESAWSNITSYGTKITIFEQKGTRVLNSSLRLHVSQTVESDRVLPDRGKRRRDAGVERRRHDRRPPRAELPGVFQKNVRIARSTHDDDPWLVDPIS